eukprot:9814690-Karenia_brevis.AAC.1
MPYDCMTPLAWVGLQAIYAKRQGLSPDLSRKFITYIEGATKLVDKDKLFTFSIIPGVRLHMKGCRVEAAELARFIKSSKQLSTRCYPSRSTFGSPSSSRS